MKTATTKKVSTGAKKTTTKKVTTEAKQTTTKKKATPKKVATPKPDLVKILEESNAEVRAAQDLVKELEDKLKAAKSDLEAKQKHRSYFRKIVNMSQAKKVDYFIWTCDSKDGESTYSKTAWKEIYRFRSATFLFTAVIKERTDLKKLKWEVDIYGSELTFGTDRYSYYTPGDSVEVDYENRNYIKNKYSDTELSQKFDSEDKARTWLNQWQLKIAEDHKDAIAYDQMLMKQGTKALKALEAASREQEKTDAIKAAAIKTRIRAGKTAAV